MNVACQHGSGGACYQLGLAQDAGIVIPRDAAEAGRNFGRACDLKTPGGCPSLVALVKKDGGAAFREPCSRGDSESCFILASVYYSAKDFVNSAELFRQSCDRGWSRACGGLAECYRMGQGVAADSAQAIRLFEKACGAGVAASCFSLGDLYRARNDEARAGQRLHQACDLSLRAATDDTAYFRAGGTTESAALPFCAP